MRARRSPLLPNSAYMCIRLLTRLSLGFLGVAARAAGTGAHGD